MMRFILLALALLVSGCEQDIQADTLSVTAFTSLNCGPCRRNEPRLREIEAIVPVLRVDVDREPRTAANSGVSRVPTYVLFQNGVETARTNDIELLARWIADYGPAP